MARFAEILAGLADAKLAVLRRAGLWDGWLRQDEILATTEELFGFWRAVEEVSGDPTVGLRLGPNLSVDGGTPQTIAALHSESFLDAIQREGQPRNAVLPDVYAEDFNAAVDFLGTRPFVAVRILARVAWRG